MNGRRYVRHDLDSLLRGDFKTRMDGLARSVQGSIRTPNEARRSEGLPDHPNRRPTSSSCRARPSSSAPHRRLRTPPKDNGDGRMPATNRKLTGARSARSRRSSSFVR
jgi:hypothetical protein